MEKKESRTGAIIGAIAAIVLCGLTGLCGLLPFGIISFTNWGKSDLNLSVGWGIGFLCLSIIFIVIGVVVPIVLLKKKKAPKVEDILPPSEPLPPVS